MNARVDIAAVSARPMQPKVLWRGRPRWSSVAVQVWKARIAAVYFAVLLADGGRMALAGTGAQAGDWSGELKLAVVATVALGGLLALAALTARTTRYEIGERGLTLRYGIAFPATLVIPYAAIEHVGIRMHRNRTGDVALRLKPGPAVMYLKLWPHARPWKFAHAEPMLRCTPDAGVAGAMICRGIAAVEAERRAVAL